MKKKLKFILLIDDNKADNYFHQMVIMEYGCAESVIVKYTGMEALKYLTSKASDTYPKPDLIFLDINMPGMNGWEFLKEYKKLDKEQKGRVIVVMLTTSLNIDDEEHASQVEEISGFENKPLTIETLKKILYKFFPDYFEEVNLSNNGPHVLEEV